MVKQEVTVIVLVFFSRPKSQGVEGGGRNDTQLWKALSTGGLLFTSQMQSIAASSSQNRFLSLCVAEYDVN